MTLSWLLLSFERNGIAYLGFMALQNFLNASYSTVDSVFRSSSIKSRSNEVTALDSGHFGSIGAKFAIVLWLCLLTGDADSISKCLELKCLNRLLVEPPTYEKSLLQVLHVANPSFFVKCFQTTLPPLVRFSILTECMSWMVYPPNMCEQFN